MNIQELSTMVQYRLPVKVFMLNNEYMGMVRQWQEFFHGGRYAESYMDSLPDFVKLAESFGATGLRAQRPEEVDDVIQAMIETPGPVIADILVDKEENVFPMIPGRRRALRDEAGARARRARGALRRRDGARLGGLEERPWTRLPSAARSPCWSRTSPACLRASSGSSPAAATTSRA